MDRARMAIPPAEILAYWNSPVCGFLYNENMKYGLPPEERGKRDRKFIGVKFECCGVYARIYYNEQQKGYFGYCPLCHRRVRVLVDPATGVDARFFSVRPGMGPRITKKPE